MHVMDYSLADDEEESTALFNARMAPPGSCLASVLRPLYRHLLHLHSQRESEGDKKGESDGGSLSQQLQDLCCSSTSGSGSDIDSANSRTISSPMFFEGPPGMTVFIHSLTHYSLTHYSLTHSLFTHLLIHNSLTHLLIRSPL